MSAGYLGGGDTYFYVGAAGRWCRKGLGLGGVCDILEGVIHKGFMSEVQRVSL
jgi:hypothetical protein